MPSRRSHTKSHHGCRQCKTRRVKCDESIPQCQRCLKRQITCSFVEDGSDGFGTPSGSSLIADHPTPQIPEQFGLETPPTPYGTLDFRKQAQIGQTPPKKQFDLMDVDLIHYYSTKTYMTMSSRLASHVVWRDTIFREGVRHDFLLHGIMATSALHKATSQLKSSEAHTKYTEVALAHQNAALAGYIPAVSTPNQDNGIALFSLSLLLTIWAFASKRLPEELKTVKFEPGSGETVPGIRLPLRSPILEFLEIVMILRGVYAVIRETESWLQGDIEELLRYPREEELPAHPPDVEEAFNVLAEAIEEFSKVDDSEAQRSPKIKHLCLEQLQRLREISRCRSLVEWDGHIFSWLIMAPLDFMNCLKYADEISIAIFAHWAAMFRCMDHHWWANGWAYSLVIEASNLLDARWSRVLEWPKRQVGIVFQESGP